jgi:hypothetical protein
VVVATVDDEGRKARPGSGLVEDEGSLFELRAELDEAGSCSKRPKSSSSKRSKSISSLCNSSSGPITTSTAFALPFGLTVDFASLLVDVPLSLTADFRVCFGGVSSLISIHIRRFLARGLGVAPLSTPRRAFVRGDKGEGLQASIISISSVWGVLGKGDGGVSEGIFRAWEEIENAGSGDDWPYPLNVDRG